MVVDDRPHVQEVALRRILKARRENQGSNSVRYFRVPSLNFSADDYIDIINRQSCEVTSPPLLEETLSRKPFNLSTIGEQRFEIQKFPCHTQAVERCVKLVTEVSRKYCDPETRDGVIRTTQRSRFQMPSFDNKGQFLSHSKTE